ncbi:MAG TPA: cupin domain-containing protein [Methylocystis sp.]|nr:cupin domain-containing protein [Methylocystis sp.]
MKFRKMLRRATFLSALGASLLAQAEEREFVRIEPEAVPFKSPLGLGPESAVLYGDPSKPGIYVVRNRFPPGAHSNPHFHSKDRHATVIKGVWYTGTGPELDYNKAVPLEAGAYMLHPAGGVHWDGAGEEEVIVQIIGEGPVETTQVVEGAPKGYWPKPK